MDNLLKFSRKISVCICTTLLMAIGTFAFTTSDNDGSAFITKAEFDALKSSFQAQLDAYNQGIDSKIDSAIAGYLAGIKVQKTSNVYTGLNLNGNGNEVKFLGKSNVGLNQFNEPYTYDTARITAAKTYSWDYCALKETYHVYIWQASYTNGNKNNFVFWLDGNGRVQGQRQNYQVLYVRNIITYSANYANYGGGWVGLWSNLSFPTADSIETSTDSLSATHVGFNSNPSTGGGVGKGKRYQYPGQMVYFEALDPYGVNAGFDTTNNYMYLSNGKDREASGTYVPVPEDYTPWNNSTFTYVTRNGAYSFNGNAVSTVYHWPKGSTDTFYCVDENFTDIANVVKASPSTFTYTRSQKLNNMPGLSATNYVNLVTIMNGSNKVIGEDKGYGLKVKTSRKNIKEIYYNNSYNTWQVESPMGNGFLFYYGNSEGVLEFKLKSSEANTKLYFKTSDYATSDDTSTNNMIDYEIKQGTGSFSSTKKFTMAKNVEYTIRLNYEKDSKLKLFAIPNADNGSTIITQTGQATFTSED